MSVVFEQEILWKKSQNEHIKRLKRVKEHKWCQSKTNEPSYHLTLSFH